MESSVPVPEVVVLVKEMELSAPVSKAVNLEAGALGQIMVPTVKAAIPISKEDVGPIVEDPLPGESVTPETRRMFLLPAPNMTTPIAIATSRQWQSLFALELAQPSALLAITQGSYWQIQFPPPFCI